MAEVHPTVAKGFDRVLSVQRPVVLAHIRSIRRRRPDATPEQVLRILERRYLTAVTTGGAAVGATAAIPAVGTATSLALSGVETAGFLEASALYAQSVTELHGIAIVEPERARTLVMALMLGNAGQDLIRQLATQAGGRGSRTAYWGEFVTRNLGGPAFGMLADRVRNAFLRRFAVTQGTSVAGRLLPFGIGAAIGGTGNHLMGRKVVSSAREAFGPAPLTFPSTLDALPPKPKRLPRRQRQKELPAPDPATGAE
jgi:hypothetical protein